MQFVVPGMNGAGGREVARVDVSREVSFDLWHRERGEVDLEPTGARGAVYFGAGRSKLWVLNPLSYLAAPADPPG